MFEFEKRLNSMCLLINEEIEFLSGVTVQFSHELLAVNFALAANRQADSNFNQSVAKPVNWDDRFVAFWVFKVSDDFIYNCSRISNLNERLFDGLDFFFPVVR